MLGQAISKNSLLLAVFALCTAGVLAGTYQMTKTHIADSERRAAQKALLEIVPADQHDNDLLTDTLAIADADLAQLGLSSPAFIHLARDNQQLVAAIIPASAPDGYSGAINMIVGVNVDGTIAGVRVLSHTETPGLGDKVELRKSDWILSFNGKSLNNPLAEKWRVTKDGGEFDQFTGATITPRAVVSKVSQVLSYFEDHKAQLLTKTANQNSTAPASSSE